MSFLGADTDEMRSVGEECQQAKETVDGVIAFLKALIALLRAASFFSGGASAAYAQYLETVVVPWMQKISMALGLFAKVLNANAEAQDQASNGESVDFGALPKYTSQVSGDSSVQPYTGGPVVSSAGGQAAQTAALGQIATIANAALGQGQGSSSTAAPTGVDGTATTPTGSAATGSTAGVPVTAGGVPVTAGGIPVTAGGVPLTAGGVPLTTGSGTGALGSGSGSIGQIASCDTIGSRPEGLLRPGSGADVLTTPRGDAPSGSGGGGGAPVGGGSGGGLGSSSIDGGGSGGSGGSDGAERSGDAMSTGQPGLHSTDSQGGGTPGGATLIDPAGASPLGSPTGSDAGGNGVSGSSYAAAGGIAAGAAALGVGGAALATKGGVGGDATIDKIAGSNGRGSSGADVRELQQRLTDAGYDTHGVDGKWGGNTEAAYQAYREANPLPVQAGTGYSSPDGFDYTQVTGVRGNERVTPEFLRGVEGVAQRVGARPEHLLAAMSFETGGSFRPDIVNPRSGATGLIQFMPDTAAGYGVSTQELARMSPTEQLPYVERYLERFRGRVGDVPSLYSSILGGHPMPSEQVMFEPGTAEYRQNHELDADGRGGITVREAADQIDRRLAGRR